MTKKDFERKKDLLNEYHENMMFATKNVVIYSGLLWLSSSLSLVSFINAFDSMDQSSTIMFGLMGATNVGFCTFEVNKIVNYLKLRKASINNFDQVLSELENRTPKIR